MSNLDIRDWFVMFVLTDALVAGTVYLFLHPSDGNYTVWSALIGTMGGIYHWIVTYDSKRPDAP